MDAPHLIRRRDALALLAAPQPSAQSQPTSPTAADTGSLYPLIEQLARRTAGAPPLPQAESRKLVFQTLGYTPPPVPPQPEVLERTDLGDIIREKLVFSTTPDFRVPAYFHLPKSRPARIPAIVDLHSHGGMFIYGKEKVIDFGDNHPALSDYHRVNYAGRPTATALARRGYAVLTIDAFPFGERRLMMDADLRFGWDRSKYSLDDIQRLNAVCRQKESAIVKSLVFAGMTWPGIVAWDDIRTVDYLVTRPEIDPARIGCCGVSLGGYRSLLLSGLDDRIAAACVVGFMSTVRPMIQRHIETHSFVHFIPGLHAHLDLPEVVALRAPKPLFVLQCKKDGLFPLSGMEEAVQKIAAAYGKAGAKSAFTAKFYDVPHIFNIEMQDDAFAWLDHHLKS